MNIPMTTIDPAEPLKQRAVADLPVSPAMIAQDWVQAWNRRDPEHVLAMFHDNAVFTSPRALRLLPPTGGRLQRREELAAYWRTALSLNPNLHFDLIDVFSGIDTIAVIYQDQDRHRHCEMLRFSHGLVISGDALTSAAPVAP